MKQSIQKTLERRLQFIIGFTQLTLMKENKFIWIACQVISDLQKIAILKLAEHMQQIHGSMQHHPGTGHDLELLFQVVNPTTFLTGSLSYQYLFAIQCVFFFLLIAPMLLVTLTMSEEIEIFEQSKYKSKNQLIVGQNENISDSIQTMHQIYNHHNYIEHFQHRLMLDQSINSIRMLRLHHIAMFLNYFPHILLLPSLYFLLESDLLIQELPDQSFQFLMIVLNIAIGVQIFLINMLSLIWVQVSFTLHDSNFMRISSSYIKWISQILFVLPLILTFFAISTGLMRTQDTVIHLLNQLILILGLVIDEYDRQVNIPYVTRFKYITIISVRSFTIFILIFSFTNYSDIHSLNLTLLMAPALARLLIIQFDRKIEHIMTHTLKRERQYTKLKRSVATSSVMQETESGGLKIESENYKYKEFQAQQLANDDQKYFIHFLSLAQQLNLKQIGVLTRNSYGKFDLKRSKILISSIVLLKAHTDNCNNQYCYCRGLKGEKRKVFEKFEMVKEMRMYDDFKILNIQFYVELIMRYLRDYAKLVFQVEIRKPNSNLMQLIQILVFLSNSDECYQAQIQILELRHKLSKNSKLEQRLAIELLYSYSKFQILNKLKESIQRNQIELTLKYEDYRLTEVERDRLIDLVFCKIQKKRESLIKLNEEKHTFESLEALLLNMSKETLSIEAELQNFTQFSRSRTPLYCYMFYCLEVSNNYDQYIKLCNLMNTRETKFFEYPSIYYKTEEQAYRVAFVLFNLAQSYGTAQRRGEVILFSKHLPGFLGYTSEEFNQIKLMDQMCYPSLIKPHDEMIEIFVLTNRPMVYRTPLQLFFQTKTPGIVVMLELFIDINFNFRNNILPCYCFLKEIKRNLRQDSQSAFMIVDQFSKIEAMTSNLLQYLDIENHELLYNHEATEFVPIFGNIKANLEDKLQRYFEQNQFEDEAIYPGQTATTQSKLIQSFSTCYDSVNMSVQIGEFTQKYQMDIEATLQFSRVNRMAYKVYYLKLKNIIKLGAECSEISPISRSLTEFSDSSNQAIKLREYVFVDNMNFQSQENLPQLELFTIRSPNGEEQKPLQMPMQIQQQQDFLNSEPKNVQSQYEDSDENDGSDQQQRVYINSLSSASSKQTEIQRILIKAHFYRLFSELGFKPLIVYVILAVNIFSLVAILTFTITTNSLNYDQQQQTKNNIYILQAFTMTAYSRATTQVQIAQDIENMTDYLSKEFERNNTKFEILEEVLHYNIDRFQEMMDQQSENAIIKNVFSSIQFTQADIYENKDTQVRGWTALFQLMYMMSSLKGDVLSQNQQASFLRALFYLLQSYEQYNEAYSKLNVRFTDEISNILSYQEAILQNILISFIIVFCAYMFLTAVLQFSYFSLVKKYLRCCEQISHQSIEQEVNHLDFVLQNYKQNDNFFDIYEYHFSLKEKYHNDDETQHALYKTAPVQNVNKKVIKIYSQFNCRRQLVFLFQNVSIIITLVMVIFQSQFDKSMITNLHFNLGIYQKCISFSESIAKATLTNFALQASPFLVSKEVLETSDQELYYRFSNTTYYEATQIMSDILYSNTDVGVQMKSLFNQDICQLVKFQEYCFNLNNGQLRQGLLLPQQEIFSIIRENNALYDEQGSATMFFTMDHLIAQNFMIDAINEYVSKVRIQIENEIMNANNQRQILMSVFYFCISVINLAQIALVYKYIVEKLWGIRQFVYLLPPKALYTEDSFFKTVTYLLKIENKLLQFF